jgi:hypothetical protein
VVAHSATLALLHALSRLSGFSFFVSTLEALISLIWFTMIFSIGILTENFMNSEHSRAQGSNSVHVLGAHQLLLESCRNPFCE